MGITLALLEGSSIFAAVCTTIIVWVHPLLIHWINIAAVLGHASTLSLCCMIAFYYNDLYDLRIVRGFAGFVSRLPQSFCGAFIFLAAFYTFFPEARIAEGSFLSSLLILLMILGILLPLRAAFYQVMRSKHFTNRVLILGTSPLALQLIEEIETQPHFGYEIVGVADEPVASGERSFHYPLLGPLKRLGKIIEEVHPDRIIVALAEWQRLPVRQLLEARVHGIVVEDGVEVYERLTGKLAIESLTPSNLIFSKDFNKPKIQMHLRRGFSLALAFIGLVLNAPLMVIIAIAIKLDSKGPVFFVQERVGLMGRTFNLMKFRTMHPVNGKTSEWVRDNGDRITRVGKWLRKFRLDELPQFVNVLRGDMDLVGPRPHPVSNHELFIIVLRNAPNCGEAIPYYSLRSVVLPGITGWAQVRYRYANDLEEEIEKIKYDLYYIKHMSFWFDLRILVDTLKVALLGRRSGASDVYRTEASMEVKAQ